MNVKTYNSAILFPGLDAIFGTKAIKKWLEKDFVKLKLDEASQILSKLSSEKEDLYQFILDAKRPHLTDFDRTLIVLTTLQVAIAEKINDSFTWDIAQGCSHGDLARNVLTGITSFEDSVEMLWVFSEQRKLLPEGYTANVRRTDLSPISGAQYQWMEERGFYASKWSHSHATIAGEANLLTQLREDAKDLGLKIKPILPYPVHSKTMSPLLPYLMKNIGRWKINKPQKTVFSSLWVKEISTVEDITKEGLENFTAPILWTETLSHLHHKFGVSKFINIGPANTLTSWILKSPEYKDLEIIDAWEALGFSN